MGILNTAFTVITRFLLELRGRKKRRVGVHLINLHLAGGAGRQIPITLP